MATNSGLDLERKMHSFNYYTRQVRKVRNLLKVMLCKLLIVLSSYKESNSPNGEEWANHGNHTNTGWNDTVQLSRQEATVLRNEALRMRRDIEGTIKCLSLTLGPSHNKEEVINAVHSSRGESSVQQQIYDLEKDLENVNNAIRTLSFFLVQCAKHGLAKSNAMKNHQRTSGQD